MQREDALPREAIVADIGGTNARFAIADLATLEPSHFVRREPNVSLPLGGSCRVGRLMEFVA